jgi:hypothetical protein
MKEYTEKEIVKLVEQEYGPNQGSGLFGRMAWHAEHRAKLKKKTPFKRKASPPSQAKPSSFSEFWKDTQ